ncbi:MAG TPA: hypothetical protein PLE45_12060 [Spirochaetota bacterium]|nr:hypothetical protein [Spirochaetota bacterium]HOL57972.1 hypothetical protein [Spirochaetota bacterium]HPP05511.1 hypothetical protein [Spirochaetota bacterium]
MSKLIIMKYRKKCKTDTIVLEKGFVYSTDLLFNIEQFYRKKRFNEALKIISKNINLIDIPSFKELSIFFDIVASILWKLGERNKAYLFWKKSYEIDNNNRHSKLSLDFLFNKKVKERYLYELFIRLKMNEFLSKKCFCSKEEKEKMVEFLTDYWNKNLAKKDLSQFDEIEAADYFISIRISYDFKK